MYSLWSNYVYIHRELWHYSRKPVLFRGSRNCVAGADRLFRGFCSPPLISGMQTAPHHEWNASDDTST